MIKTGSVLEKLCAAVDRQRHRVARETARVEELREEYKTCHWSKRRDVAGKGFRARAALDKAAADLKAAELALHEEEVRLSQPDSFLRFA